jgi:transcriptional regulator with PAS, ATPase and Fis domain
MSGPDTTMGVTATVAATLDGLGVVEALAGPGPALVLAFGADGLRDAELLPLRRKITLGRGSDAFGAGALDDRRMSREHCHIIKRRTGWFLDDADSRNGTRLDGQIVTEPRPLKPGSVVRAGDSLFVFVNRELEPSRDLDDDIVGWSDAAVRLRRTLSAVAPHQATVLLTGETGTGKEVAAKALHRMSGRTGDFIAVNCGAFSEGMLESELFGHRKGAFTGAVSDHPGLFRSAEGGTLFLDEVGEMPLALQVKLLRVLEARTVRPVGGTKDVAVDVRVVAATNRDLVTEVQSGRFRSDLYARLSQWLVPLAPLRDRKEDVPLLARHLLGLAGERSRAIRSDLAEALLLHDWPLNVRGLVNVVRMSRIASGEGPLGLTDEVRAAIDAAKAIANLALQSMNSEVSDLRVTLASVPRIVPPDDVVEEGLRSSGGKVAAAARSLNLSRQQIYRWLEAKGQSIDDYRE